MGLGIPAIKPHSCCQSVPDQTREHLRRHPLTFPQCGAPFFLGKRLRTQMKGKHLKITDRVTLLRMGFAGLPQQNAEAQQHLIQILEEYLDGIEEYLEKHLPSQNRDYGDCAVTGLRRTTEALFADPTNPRTDELFENLCQLIRAAHFVPDEKQDI
jgi:hypothetical protein